MARIRRIVIYIGVLLTILSVFVPVVSLEVMGETQSFSIMDNGLLGYILGGIIVLMAASVLFLMTLKKHKIMFVPTFIDIVLFIITISQIYNMDDLKMVEYKREISNILFPCGIIITIFGEVLLVFSSSLDKMSVKHKESKLIDKAIDNLGEMDADMEAQLAAVQEDSPSIDPSTEQIPVSNISFSFDEKLSTNNKPVNQPVLNNVKSFEPDVVENIEVNGSNENLIFDNEVKLDSINTVMENTEVNNIASNNVIDNYNINNIPSNNVVDNYNMNSIPSNNVVDNFNMNNIPSNNVVDNNVTSENVSYNVVNNYDNDDSNVINVSYSIATPIIDDNNDEDIIQNIPMTSLYDDAVTSQDDFEFLPDLDDEVQTSNDDMIDIASNVISDEVKIESDNYSDIPEINSENYMFNNVQEPDEVKPQYMAINPSDRINNEEEEQDYVEDRPIRQLPRLKNRSCSFCNTPLGDDERICPECGRIN